MKMKRSTLFGLAVGISALAFSSCAYDPYYAGGGGYGYGDGYGYGGSGFSTSVFVSTGNPRWGYDPYAGAYYDYTRRCYYDPHLYGYYPVGYRPRYVYGAPHPHGWSRGQGHCPPPRYVRSHYIRDYHDRDGQYRSLGRSWSDNVRVSNPGRDQDNEYRDRDRDNSRGMQRPPREEYRSSPGPIFGNPGNGDRDRYNAPQRSSGNVPDFRKREREDGDDRSFRSSSYGNGFSPNAFSRQAPDRGIRESGGRAERSAPEMQRKVREVERPAPQFERRENNGGGRNEDKGRSEKFKIRGLGEG